MYPFTCFTSSDSSFIVLLLETTVFSTGFRRSFLSLFCKSTASINGLLPSSSFHGLMLFQATAFPTRPPPPPDLPNITTVIDQQRNVVPRALTSRRSRALDSTHVYNRFR
ncbi:unnamed protein product [Lactuca virosa]|uniref:Uncharacterized protein n=1 Tax=Lactuca virosa TaxID=75947 RepID=A0AAU9NRX3_9ASTR|nr:unnamed protein product [Lactuca virosa]